jgi:hypothetical protein
MAKYNANGEVVELVELTGSNITSPTGDNRGAFESLPVIAIPHGYSGSGFDRWRNNTEGTLLASAARTSTSATPTQTNHNAKGVMLTLNITGNPGGTETLTLWLQYFQETGAHSEIVKLTTESGINGGYRLVVYPGVSLTPDANGTKNIFKNTVLPRSWVAKVVPSGTGSWTYSLGYSLIL